MAYEDTLKYRVEQLETEFNDLDSKIDKILTNHLPHIELAILQVKTRVNTVTMINVAAIVIGLVIQKLFLK